MENRHIEVEWREPDEAHDDHDEEMTITAALDVLDEKEVKLFMELEDWRPRAGDSAMLWARACEIAGSEKCFCSDLQLALRELRGQDPEFGRYVKPAEPEPEVVHHQVDTRGIIHVGSDGGTRTLVVDPEVRRELQALPIEELARRASRDRHANLSEQRKLQIKADEI